MEEPEFKIFGWESSPAKTAILVLIVLLLPLTTFRLLYENTKMKLYVPESCFLVLAGLVVGAIIALSNDEGAESLLKFPADLLLNLFIPVIIFDATYFLNKQAFFTNFMEIATYAVVGTLLSTLIIGGLLIASKSSILLDFSAPEQLTYAALVSAVDPVAVIAIMESMHVNENLFNLAFGESTLNDGVAIALFNVFKSLESLLKEGRGGWTIFMLGIAKFLVSVLGAVVTALLVTAIFAVVSRVSHKIQNTEPLLMLLCAMAAYTLSDALLFSGVIAVMVCALVLVRYVEPNFQQQSITTFQNLIRMLAQALECMLFFDMGAQIAFVAKSEERVDWFYAIMPIIFSLLARVIAVTLQTFVLNINRQKLSRQLSWREQVILVFCGLRGGIAFALASSWALSPAKQTQMLFSCSMLIIFTVFAYGLSMRPLISKLRITLQLPNSSRRDFASATLARPIVNVCRFADVLTGKSSWFHILSFKADRVLQSVFLKQKLVMDRELLRNIDQIRQIYRQKREKEEADIQLKQQIEWQNKYFGAKPEQGGANNDVEQAKPAQEQTKKWKMPTKKTDHAKLEKLEAFLEEKEKLISGSDDD